MGGQRVADPRIAGVLALVGVRLLKGNALHTPARLKLDGRALEISFRRGGNYAETGGSRQRRRQGVDKCATGVRAGFGRAALAQITYAQFLEPRR